MLVRSVRFSLVCNSAKVGTFLHSLESQFNRQVFHECRSFMLQWLQHIKQQFPGQTALRNGSLNSPMQTSVLWKILASNRAVIALVMTNLASGASAGLFGLHFDIDGVLAAGNGQFQLVAIDRSAIDNQSGDAAFNAAGVRHSNPPCRCSASQNHLEARPVSRNARSDTQAIS